MTAETKRHNAEELVDALFADLNDRSGFDTGGLDEETLAEWREKWVQMAIDAMETT